MIDLRSDTVTKPTPEMRRAMADAEVGDEVLGDDPTVKDLERQTAAVLGKEAAVYMPSGTMTNQVAIRCHTEPGDEILIADNAHVFFYEAGAPGGVSGVMCRMLPSDRGIFTAEAVRAALRPRNYHHAPTKLVCVENTSNRGGGSIWPIDVVADVAAAAREASLAMHLDGARLWNASVATGVSEAEYAGHFASVSVCFSKGLGAPVGSCLAGSVALVDRARRFRKMLGGGMRQAGVIAAGALYALRNHRQRLADDHANAKALAEGIADLPGIDLDAATVETNIVIFRVTCMPAAELAGKLKDAGVLVLATAPDRIRAVTNLMVSRDDIRQAVETFGRILR
jgi:threonine aldolase